MRVVLYHFKNTLAVYLKQIVHWEIFVPCLIDTPETFFTNNDVKMVLLLIKAP